MEKQEFLDTVAMTIITSWAALPLRRYGEQARKEAAKEAYDIAEALWNERKQRTRT